jgi:mono/diheme cytochrome c family protein
MTPQELLDLGASLAPATGGSAEGPLFVLPGRPELGRSLFVDKGCVQCHKVGGTGGAVGPDLVALSARRSPIEFAAAIWNKEPAMLKAMASQNVKVPQLSPEEMADLVAYLYSVGYFAGGGSIPRGWWWPNKGVSTATAPTASGASRRAT